MCEVFLFCVHNLVGIFIDYHEFNYFSQGDFLELYYTCCYLVDYCSLANDQHRIVSYETVADCSIANDQHRIVSYETVADTSRGWGVGVSALDI